MWPFLDVLQKTANSVLSRAKMVLKRDHARILSFLVDFGWISKFSKIFTIEQEIWPSVSKQTTWIKSLSMISTDVFMLENSWNEICIQAALFSVIFLTEMMDFVKLKFIRKPYPVWWFWLVGNGSQNGATAPQLPTVWALRIYSSWQSKTPPWTWI